MQTPNNSTPIDIDDDMDRPWQIPIPTPPREQEEEEEQEVKTPPTERYESPTTTATTAIPPEGAPPEAERRVCGPQGSHPGEAYWSVRSPNNKGFLYFRWENAALQKKTAKEAAIRKAPPPPSAPSVVVTDLDNLVRTLPSAAQRLPSYKVKEEKRKWSGRKRKLEQYPGQAAQLRPNFDVVKPNLPPLVVGQPVSAMVEYKEFREEIRRLRRDMGRLEQLVREALPANDNRLKKYFEERKRHEIADILADVEEEEKSDLNK
jgi:hypothetical protein